MLAVWRKHNIGECHCYARPWSASKAEILQSVECCSNLSCRIAGCDPVDDLRKYALRHLLVYERIVDWQSSVEQNASTRSCKQYSSVLKTLFAHNVWAAWLRINNLKLGRLPILWQNEVCRNANQHLSLHVNLMLVESHFSFSKRGEDSALTLGSLDYGRQVVKTQNHILRWHCNGVTVCWLQDIVGSHHQSARFSLSFCRKRKMHCHLVTIEVCVECCAGKWWQVDCFTFNQNWLECLNTQAVKCRCAVKKHRMLGNNFLEHAPNFGVAAVNQTLCALHILSEALIYQTLNNERLEKLQCHWLWQTALMHAKAWTNDDYGTAGIINTLTEQVLAESALLTLKHVGKRL